MGSVTGNEDDHAYQGVQNCNELPTHDFFNHAFPVKAGKSWSRQKPELCEIVPRVMFYENGTFLCNFFGQYLKALHNDSTMDLDLWQ